MPSEAPFSHIPDWPVVRLGDICVKIGSGATPKGGSETYLSNRVNFALVRSQNVFDRRFSNDGLAFISNEQAAGLRSVVLRSGDLLLNITGDGVTFCRACKVPSSVLPACVNQHVAIVRVNPDEADPRFVLSYLTHPTVKLYMESFNTGGSRRAITKGHIESFCIPLPPLREQAAIGEFLSAFDDRIETLIESGAILEGMAQAIFRSWFIDFDPVKERSEGRDSEGMDIATATLFPSEFQDSELGPIPKGWSILRLGDQIAVSRDSVSPGLEPNEEFEHFSIPAFDDGKIARIELGSEIKSNKTRVQENSVLLSKLNPSIPRAWLPNLHRPSRAVCSTEFLVLLPGPRISREYIFSLCCDSGFLQRLAGLTTGTSNSHQRVKANDLMNERFCFPTANLVKAFTEIAKPLLGRFMENIDEAQTLARIRDTLLPKLISGQLRVPEAEKCLAEVTV